jgi:hypothetical protein
LPIWVLVINKMATLEELETSWSLDDVMRIHAILEMREDLNREIEKERKPKNVNR